MPDIYKPTVESARNTKLLSDSLRATKTIVPSFEDISVVDSPWSAPAKIRAVTFVLWGITNVDTVTISLPASSKTFDGTRYEGFAFSYAIDVSRDCKLSEDITITIVGTATVDIIYTIED